MCSVKISKVSGCNHMTCLFCKYEFCWVCGGESTTDHFNILNPLNCGASQFMDNPPNKWLRYLFKLVVMTIAIMMLPMILLLTCPVCCASLGWMLFLSLCFGYSSRRSCFMVMLKLVFGVIAVIMFFAIGMVINILVIPSALLAMGIASWVYIGVIIIRQYRNK